MRITFLISLILFALGTSAEIHTWVDENGKKHFSDKLPDHLKHKSATVDYSSSIPSEAERAEAQRIYKQSQKHADGIPKTRAVSKKSSTTQNTSKKKHLTRNDKYKLRQEAEAKAKEQCAKFNASQRACMNPMMGNCSNMKRPPNCV